MGGQTAAFREGRGGPTGKASWKETSPGRALPKPGCGLSPRGRAGPGRASRGAAWGLERRLPPLLGPQGTTNANSAGLSSVF